MTIEPQPTSPSPPTPPFQFSLRTLLLLFVVLGSSLAVFGAWGIVVFILVVGLAISVRRAELPPSPMQLLSLLVCLLGLLVPLMILSSDPGRCSNFFFTDRSSVNLLMPDGNWPNIAALVVWLASMGTLLIGAVRSRKST